MAKEKSDLDGLELKKAPKFVGVVYDVGLNFNDTGFSVEPFDPALVEQDLAAIAKSLHATTVRIEGEEIHRLVTSARIAHKFGLSVFFNPWKINASAEELRRYFTEAAQAAEVLRKEGVDIVFVTGCEYPIFHKGIIPGDSLADRLAVVGEFFRKDPKEHVEGWKILNRDLKSFVDVIRPKFAGPVTYAATSIEQVDWSIFDIVGVDHYRGAETADHYVAELDKYRIGKPLVIMEVGCCTYVGAAKLGGGGFFIIQGVNPDGSGVWKDGVTPVRSEREQADYVETQVKLLSNANVDGVFIFLFSFPFYPTGEGAKDLDMASFALVKTFAKDDPRSAQMPPWAPKESFYRLAGLYEQMKSMRG